MFYFSTKTGCWLYTFLLKPDSNPPAVPDLNISDIMDIGTVEKISTPLPWIFSLWEKTSLCLILVTTFYFNSIRFPSYYYPNYYLYDFHEWGDLVVY